MTSVGFQKLLPNRREIVENGMRCIYWATAKISKPFNCETISGLIEKSKELEIIFQYTRTQWGLICCNFVNNSKVLDKASSIERHITTWYYGSRMNLGGKKKLAAFK